MAPALTKFVKDGHGIHLSSPPASSEQSVMGVMDSQLRPSEDLQKMLLSVLPSLDSYLQANPLDLPSGTGHSGSRSLPSMDCCSAKSYNKRIPHLAPSMLPGASDMCFLPEHKAIHRLKSTCQCRPGARDAYPLCSLSSVFPRFEYGDDDSVLATTTRSNKKTCSSDQLVPNVELQSRIRKRISRQTGLHIRAHNLQKRLEALLGQHAVLHCDQQLEGLRTRGFIDQGGFPAASELSQGDSKLHFPWPQTHFTEIKQFSQGNRAVLTGLTETLDSEATASSSSDDEPVDSKASSKYREPCVASPCFERRWLDERAELGSRWSWLQLRVSELDGRIQQLMKLHKNIRSTKGCVVLADSQPMTSRQMRKEVSGLSCTTLDADNEPCSPTRLLHNIERQSAQLSQIVNSLMSPLTLSPLSKPRKDKRAFESDVFVSGSTKRRKFDVRRRRQQFKDNMSCVCARTRPLVIYHKPRLFRLNSVCNNSTLKCSSTLSGLASCYCSYGSPSSEPVLVCSDPDNSSKGTLTSRTCSSNSGDSALLRRFTKGSAREEWSQIPLVINALPLSPAHYRRHSSTPLYNSYKYKHYTHHHNKRVLGLSPIKHLHGVQREGRVHQRKRKRRRRNSFTEDEDDDCDSSDEIFQESFVLVSQKQNNTRGAVRRHYGERLFDIDNIVIPSSLTKVEKLQYKDILTPCWQVLNVQSISKDEDDSRKDKDEEIEILTDEVFAQRHLPFELKEKMRWSFWGKRHCGHSLRSGSRLSHSMGEIRMSEDNSVEWSFTQLDPDEQLSSEECLPQVPWERRMFPLNDDEETLLSSEVLQCCSDSTCTLSSSTSLNPDLTLSQSTQNIQDATLPSRGHYMDRINSGTGVEAPAMP
uniref:PEHE domain-containing protein n=1 Tax=Neogobius melanostomus TaxID=47308 RepID=A0A8C6T0Q3_9GOBI